MTVRGILRFLVVFGVLAVLGLGGQLCRDYSVSALRPARLGPHDGEVLDVARLLEKHPGLGAEADWSSRRIYGHELRSIDQEPDEEVGPDCRISHTDADNLGMHAHE